MESMLVGNLDVDWAIGPLSLAPDYHSPSLEL